MTGALVRKKERAYQLLSLIPDQIVDDVNSSSEYRKFVLQNLVIDAINTLERQAHE